MRTALSLQRNSLLQFLKPIEDNLDLRALAGLCGSLALSGREDDNKVFTIRHDVELSVPNNAINESLDWQGHGSAKREAGLCLQRDGK